MAAIGADGSLALRKGPPRAKLRRNTELVRIK